MVKNNSLNYEVIRKGLCPFRGIMLGQLLEDSLALSAKFSTIPFLEIYPLRNLSLSVQSFPWGRGERNDLNAHLYKTD